MFADLHVVCFPRGFQFSFCKCRVLLGIWNLSDVLHIVTQVEFFCVKRCYGCASLSLSPSRHHIWKMPCGFWFGVVCPSQFCPPQEFFGEVLTSVWQSWGCWHTISNSCILIDLSAGTLQAKSPISRAFSSGLSLKYPYEGLQSRVSNLCLILCLRMLYHGS